MRAEILQKLGETFALTYTVSAGGGYFCNVRRLAEFGPQKVVLGGRGERLVVEGENFALGKCEAGDIMILGKIKRIQVEE